MMMTSREVVDNLLRGKKAERVGLMDSPWGDTIAAWVQQGYPTRMVVQGGGRGALAPEDGRWVEVEVAGEYEEPVPAWEHFRLRHGRRRPLVRRHAAARLRRAGRRDRRVGGPAQRRGRGAQVLEAQVGHAGAHRLSHDHPRDLGARLPPAPARSWTRSASTSSRLRKNIARSATQAPGVDALWPHVHLGADAPEHGRCDHVREPAARPGLDPRL